MQPSIGDERSAYSAMGPGFTEYEPCYRYSDAYDQFSYHCHDFYELYVNLNGGRYYNFDGYIYSLEPNQLLIMPPFRMHGHVFGEPLYQYERVFLNITRSALRAAGCGQIDIIRCLTESIERGQYLYTLSADKAAECKRLIMESEERLMDQTPEGHFFSYTAMLSYLAIICGTISTDKVISQPVVVNRVMLETLSYIDDHFTEPLSLDMLAHRFSISQSYLCHDFVRYTGRSVYDYILYRRIMLAKELVFEGMALSSVAYRCGFGDYSGFLRVFKKVAGMSPSAYRKQCLRYAQTKPQPS